MGRQAAADRGLFLFATCQVGAEAALKAEVARTWPGFRFAYSRGGFLTFKLPERHGLSEDFDPGLVFARASGFSLGKVAVESLDAAAGEVWKVAAPLRYQALHVWQRDTAAIGYRGFEPHVTPSALAAEEAIRRHEVAQATSPALARVAEPGDRVLDCVLVEPHEWWIGFHTARDDDSRFDFIDRDRYGGNLMRSEIVNHENLGVPREVFPAFFVSMRDAFAELLGDAWTLEFDAAWVALLGRIDAALEKT